MKWKLLDEIPINLILGSTVIVNIFRVPLKVYTGYFQVMD